MKKKNLAKLKVKKTVISKLSKVKGGLGWISLPHTDCFCWPPSTDTFWDRKS
ncbi:hypothetical protein [Kordia sp.]|uniref:hypothetical protein n=1 Tax=Kordia sp. TaxID=1965332 RepID=UPI003D2C52EC